eukprot:XP_027328622.1 uncharacterized protein LOC113845729 isoform X2 [Anas platyrhynchos]
MAAGPSRAECRGHGAEVGRPPSVAAPDTVALCQGSPAGAEALGAVPPQILVTDFSAASPTGWHCPDPQPEPGEEDGEQDAREASEDGSSSVGASPVALDPVEKEWLQGAAGGDLPVLSHLLQQEPALATKKDFTSGTALHWAAKHGKEDMATMLVGAGADINMRAHGVSMLGWTDGRAAGLARTGGPGVGRGRGVPRAVGRGVPSRVVAAAGGPQEGVGWGALVSPPGSRRCWGATAQPRAPPRGLVSPRVTPPCTSPRSTAIARSWSCSSSALNLRDYSGHLAGHYLGSVGTLDGDPDTPQLPWAGVSAAGTGGWAACCCPRPAGPRGAAGARPRTSRSRRKSEPQRSSSRPPRPTGPSASSPASTAPAPRCRGGLGAQDRRRGRALPGSAVKLRVHRVPAAVPVCAVPLGPWPRVGLGSTAPHSAPARGGSAQGWGGPAVGAGHTAAVPCRPLPHGSWCGG